MGHGILPARQRRSEMSEPVRAALLLHTCLEVLREAAEPLPKLEVQQRIAARMTFTPHELELVGTDGAIRWQNFLGWHTGDMATIGWLSKRDGLWEITDAGVSALERYTPDQLFAELQRRYTEIRKQRQQAVQAMSGGETRIADALSVLDPGAWTSYDDIADLAGTDAQTVAHFLAGAKSAIANAYRVLNPDGSVPPDGMLHLRFRGMDVAKKLRMEGVEFDPSGHASQTHRITAEQFQERVLAAEPATSAPRAWLVRGSSVDGRDLVPVWLERGSVSLAASNLRPVTPPVPRADLKSFVDEDYAHKSYAARQAKVAEFDAFCNRMRPGDYMLTTSQGNGFLGHIEGDATYVASDDKRSNLRRSVTWLNAARPVAFSRLPEPLPAKLHSQSDVVDLTEDMAAIEALLADVGAAAAPDPGVRKALAFPEIPEELAAEVLIDRPWLQRQADLLWDRRQMIFYGPPGTGKTFLARRLAMALAEPSAVKLVQFHPSYTYEDFFEGFRPSASTDGTLAFDLRKGPFRKLVEDAREHPADPYLLIIDEINRANLAKVFGELYFLLEYRDSSVNLMYSPEEEFTLPPNVFVIGTMNTTDRSIALLDAAIRRRFAFVELHPSSPPIAGLLAAWLDRQSGVEFNRDTPQLLHALNARIEDRDLAVGPSYFMRPEIYRREDGLDRVWETSVLPLLAEYHYGSPPEVLRQFHLDTLRKTIAAGSGEAVGP
jgi:5-methylcytosine-specific restriction protein B